MKKQFRTSPALVKHVIFSACLLGAGSSFAVEQDFGANDTPRADLSRAQASELGGGSLPSIRSGRSEQRQAKPLSSNATSKRSVADADAPVGAFEEYVDGVTGKKLSIFGKDLFSDVPSTFAPLDGVQVNQEYVIGTGDELQVRGWGMVDIDVSATVDRSGAIFIPRVGSIKVSGVQYKDLQGYLKKAISKIYTNFDLTASIAQTRAVQVYVVGHAVRPGTYTLNSMSTLLNALFTSGGPDATGSMRSIQLKRGKDTVTTFDLYDMLVKGDKSRDITLRDGDVIYIPEVGPLVALTGSVKQPAIFELKGKASLADVVNWSGGFDSAAETKQVIVEKSVDNQYKTVLDLVADGGISSSKLAGIAVNPTDILRVFAPGAVPVQAQIQNEYVRVAGEAKQSGIFLLKKGETLRELIARVGGANDNGYLYATQLTRESVRRAQQIKLDQVADRFERDLDSNATQRMAATGDKDSAAKTAAEVEQQRRIVQKMRNIKAEGRIVLDLPGVDTQVKNLPDIPLQDGDSVLIPRRPGTVDVLGSVFQQNAFVYRPQRTVNDYVQQAGGITSTADKSEMYVIRADGTAQSGQGTGWFSGLGGTALNPGDTVVVPEKIERSTFMQSLKDWTAIFYQFGLGAAGLKVLKD
ncbi:MULTISPECIES: SLBB domain-containing protein [unclassified Janthinobacterium]|uniref:polysaccharide biosynthesis/export family protein n=1 Tax=unclassified Janthinobacterium TaxID=2610881 RepID=UPI0016100E95|nr:MULTISPECIES: SLBB domain-containing protein [unclassified Janthinobacterium]MBB5608592.1 protein involved in polysaccharide export with SLBB domain [Janthinobacterium sp. S3T4]MBB5614113.1 protein involved in polysaccharide export with SLBB domain [Janthinobacterium sp. S3M3]